MSSVSGRGLEGPSRPETRIHYSENELKGEFLFVEDTQEPDAWMTVDDQHVYPVVDLE